MRDKLASVVIGILIGFTLVLLMRAIADDQINDGCPVQWETI